MRTLLRTALVVALAALGVAGASSATGRPGCLVSNSRTDFGARTLQEAVDAAEPGDELVVKGRCVGSTTIEEDLTLKGVSNPAFGAATLDGAGGGTVLTVGRIGSPVVVELSGLAITGGVGMGGGVYNRNLGGSLTVRESTIVGNTSTSNGGGGIFNVGTLTVVDSTVADNVSTTGTQWGFGGGGIRNQIGNVALLRTQVEGNVANAAGGGIYNVGGGTVTVTDSVVSGNTAGTRGGGIDGSTGAVAVVRSAVVDNSAAEGGGGIASGGLTAFAATLTVVDSTIARNTATGSPGAGGGLLNEPNGSVSIAGSAIVGNSAIRGGGGIRNTGRTLTISGSTIDGNTAASGGGLYNASFFLGRLFVGHAELVDVTISRNVASEVGGGVFNAATLLRTNVTFSANAPDDCFGACA
jgi:hypothetical protein